MPNIIALPPLVVTGASVWMLFAFVATLWAVATLILEYHWNNYAVDGDNIVAMRFLYRIGSFFLLMVIFLTALSYSLS